MIIMDGSKLLEKCQAGDQLAVEQLVHEYQPRLYRLALSILDDGSENGSAEAEEATQDALFKALRSLDSYRGEAALSTWLYAITVNLCRNRLRSRRRRERARRLFQILVPPLDDIQPRPEDILLDNEVSQSLMKAVYGLNEKHRLPVILRYYHAFSVREIAHILDVPEGTAHSRLNTARKRLKNYLQIERSKEISDE